jgi:hypothetical protein
MSTATTPPDFAPDALVIRTTARDGAAYGGFVWPRKVGAIVKAPDWSPEAVCGRGLHGLLDGNGNWTLLHRPTALWWLVEVVRSECVEIDGDKVKFPRCRVKYFGSSASAVIEIMARFREIQTANGLALVERLSAAATTGYGSAAATTGYGSAAATTGARSAAATTGARSAAATTGYGSAAATTGARSAAATTGAWSAAATTGDGSAAATTGARSAAATTGAWSAAATTGARSAAATTGAGSAAATTGARSAAATTGAWSAAATTGAGSAAATTGAGSAAATTGAGSAAATTGDGSAAATTGRQSIAAALGPDSKAKAGIDGWIVCTAWDKPDIYDWRTWTVACVRAAKVGGVEGVEADTWYRLTLQGEFQEVSDASSRIFGSAKPMCTSSTTTVRHDSHA